MTGAGAGGGTVVVLCGLIEQITLRLLVGNDRVQRHPAIQRVPRGSLLRRRAQGQGDAGGGLEIVWIASSVGAGAGGHAGVGTDVAHLINLIVAAWVTDPIAASGALSIMHAPLSEKQTPSSD